MGPKLRYPKLPVIAVNCSNASIQCQCPHAFRFGNIPFLQSLLNILRDQQRILRCEAHLQQPTHSETMQHVCESHTNEMESTKVRLEQHSKVKQSNANSAEYRESTMYSSSTLHLHGAIERVSVSKRPIQLAQQLSSGQLSDLNSVFV